MKAVLAAAASAAEATGQPLSPRLQQFAFPEILFPELLETNYRRNAMRYAAALLGAPLEHLSTWSYVIVKPSVIGAAIPWHQDKAYWDADLEYQAIGCWLPLYSVTVEQSCMQFIPGSHHRGLLRHERHDVDGRLNLLTAPMDNDAAAVACPLPTGGATFHHSLTLHYTTPNITDEPASSVSDAPLASAQGE